MISIKAKHPLEKPSDLKGLQVGVSPAAGSAYIFLKTFLSQNGMSLDDIKQNTVSPPYENYLVMGRVDAIPGYIDAEVPELEAKTGGPGSLSILQGADYGYVAFGSGLLASDKLIKDNPDLVKRFVKGYLEAMAYVADHPDEAVADIVKANPEYKGKEDVLLEELKFDIASSFFTANTKAHGIGWISPDQWSATVKMLQKEGALPATASATPPASPTSLSTPPRPCTADFRDAHRTSPPGLENPAAHSRAVSRPAGPRSLPPFYANKVGAALRKP